MPDLIHYILVRRDLPFGTTLAMVGHAAADSMEGWARSWFRYHRKHDGITMVVLGVAGFMELIKAKHKLLKEGLLVTSVYDSFYDKEGVEHGVSLLSLGIEPGDRETLAPFFRGYGTYKEFGGTPPQKPIFPPNTITISEQVVKNVLS